MIEIIIGTESVTEVQGVPAYLHEVSLAGSRLSILTRADAVANRMLVYGLETVEEAICAIVKEHATRELGLGADPGCEGKLSEMGGLRQDVTVKRGTEADLPPIPKPEPSAKDVALIALEAATTLAGLKAAMTKYLQSV